MKKLTGMLLYVSCATPVDCFEKTKGQEYKASVVVDEDTADAFAELYPKQAAKKVKRTEFEKLYGVAPPEGEEKNLYIITLKKNSRVKDYETGDLKPLPEKFRPIVYEQTVEDGVKVRTNVTKDKLPANGSYGSISIFHKSSEQYGDSASLQDVLVTEFIEYERKAGSGDPQDRQSVFDDEDGDEAPKAKAPKAEPKAPAKPKAKPKAQAEDADDPF